MIVDPRILVGEAFVLQTYCPDKLQPYPDKIENVKLRHTVKGN